MNTLTTYTNGNTKVTILEDGTKIREYTADTPYVTHPESIDVKITNHCDMGCKYCHESSTTDGKHGDLNALLNTLSVLPPGVELAIGGGNPLSHPGLVGFLQAVKTKGFIANITVNQGHVKRYLPQLTHLIRETLIHGLGMSITNNNLKYVRGLLPVTNNIVYHVIAGVNPVSVLDDLLALGNCKVLVLGYKAFGFGVGYYDQDVYRSLQDWYRELPRYLSKCIVSFDNLAIRQLQVERLLTKDAWARLYMGDDFEYSMYIDAVEKTYAPSSTHQDRTPMDIDLVTYFTNNKHKPNV